MEELWVDNDVFNYLCKASCLQEVLQSVPYTLCTTELVQGEAEAASSVLQSAIDAMMQGAITVHPLGKPPLDVPLPRVGGLSPADHSLITCAHHLGGQVLRMTNASSVSVPLRVSAASRFGSSLRSVSETAG